MSRHSRALAGLTLVIAVGVGGLVLTRQMIAVAGEADAERLNRSILQYVALKNPQAPPEKSESSRCYRAQPR
jgi:hypothetical protein